MTLGSIRQRRRRDRAGRGQRAGTSVRIRRRGAFPLTAALYSIACAPEPLNFSAVDAASEVAPQDGSTGDSSNVDSSASDSSSKEDALAHVDALPPPTVYLLARPNIVDPTVEQLRSELDAFGIAYTELEPSAAGIVALSRAVIVAGFSSKSSTWSSAAVTVMDAVKAGAWILIEGFALYLLDEADVEGVATSGWLPGCKDAFYFVAPIAPIGSPFFDGMPAWDPPESPDEPTQSLRNVVTQNIELSGAVLEGDAAALWTKHEFWELATRYGCAGLPTDSSYCQSWGKCAVNRSVWENGIRIRPLGSGRVGRVQEVPVVPGVFAWGSAGALIHRNFIQWAIGEISKR